MITGAMLVLAHTLVVCIGAACALVFVSMVRGE